MTSLVKFHNEDAFKSLIQNPMYQSIHTDVTVDQIASVSLFHSEMLSRCAKDFPKYLDSMKIDLMLKMIVISFDHELRQTENLPQILQNILTFLDYTKDCETDYIQIFIDSGFIDVLDQLEGHKNHNVNRIVVQLRETHFSS